MYVFKINDDDDDDDYDDDNNNNNNTLSLFLPWQTHRQNKKETIQTSTEFGAGVI